MMHAGRPWHASHAGLGGLGSLVGLKESLCAGVLRVRWSFETVNNNRGRCAVVSLGTQE